MEIITVTREDLFQLIRDAVKAELSNIPKPKEDEKFISSAEVCKMLNISRGTLHNWSQADKIRKYSIGGRVLYKHSEVVEAVEKIQRYK
jgi:excisionase family DNA binding protein